MKYILKPIEIEAYQYAESQDDAPQWIKTAERKANSMDIVRRALLGDKKAQEELTEKGELLPCPFCRNEKNIISNWGLWRVWCPVCKGKADDTLTRKDAIKAWNTRPQILTDEEMERFEGRD